jgi:DNA-binding transcriptional ArsR family regulator
MGCVRCASQERPPKELTQYRVKERLRIRADILRVLDVKPMTVREMQEAMGTLVRREVFFHYDGETGRNCFGHLGITVETSYQDPEIRRNLAALRKNGMVEYFDEGVPPYLWYRRTA